ncbi:MAG: TIGR03617 family F420-dependent LLM class oxidoreductase [bacterium]
MKFDVQLTTYDLAKLPASARRLERMGFDGLWSWETDRNPYIPLAFAATATEKITLGTNIALAFPRTPMITAMAAWDIQRASAGRFLLGLGTQVRAHNERRLSAPSDSPAERVKEMIQCIRAIWDTFQNGTRPDFEGRFYQFRLITPFFNPGPIDHPRIPIFLAGVKARMCRTAGEVADGFHVHPFHSARYLREVVRPNLEEGAKKAGRALADLELFSPVFTVSGETEAERTAAEATVREQIAFYSSTPNYRDVLELHGWRATGEELSQMARRGEWAQMAGKISDEMLDTFAVAAPPTKLAAALRERYEGLVDRISLYVGIPDEGPEEPMQVFLRAFRQAAP